MSDYNGNPNIASLVTSTEIPDDGKKLKASDVNVALEAAFDNFAFLKGRGVVAVYNYVFDNENLANWIVEQFTTTAYVDGTKVILTVPSTRVGDVLLVDFAAFFSCNMVAVGDWGNVRLVATPGYGGPSAVTSAIAGTRIFLLGAYAFPGDPPGARHLNTMGSATAGLLVTVAGTVRIGVQGKAGFSGGNVQILSIAKLRGVLLRPI